MKYTAEEYKNEFRQLLQRKNYLRKMLQDEIKKLAKLYPDVKLTYKITYYSTDNLQSHLKDNELCDILKQFEDYGRSKTTQLELFN